MNSASDNEKPAQNPSGYVQPAYIHLEKSDKNVEEEITSKDAHPTQMHSSDGVEYWSNGIFACFEDIPSCAVGFFCPCYLFAKNAVFLGSETFIAPCATHFLLYSVMNMFCGLYGQGLILGIPGCFVACYAFSFRKTLRSKYNLPESPCHDFVTHFFCHLCAICQEYREISERSVGSVSLDLPTKAAPPVQKMDSSSTK